MSSSFWKMKSFRRGRQRTNELATQKVLIWNGLYTTRKTMIAHRFQNLNLKLNLCAMTAESLAIQRMNSSIFQTMMSSTSLWMNLIKTALMKVSRHNNETLSSQLAIQLSSPNMNYSLKSGLSTKHWLGVKIKLRLSRSTKRRTSFSFWWKLTLPLANAKILYQLSSLSKRRLKLSLRQNC